MARKRKGNPVHGWVNFNKPYGMGSTQAVGKIRWLFTAQKAGHAGTLDPLADGVLPIALGDATKTVAYMMDAAKTYEFEIKWGKSTATLDAEGEVTATSDVRPTAGEIEAVLSQFTGDIEQVPPKYSAIKIDGQRAYDLARAGADIEMVSRRVRVDALSLLEATDKAARLRVDCGKGTYVRSLMRDICTALGTEGHVSMLRRTRVGAFTLGRAFSLDCLEDLLHKARVLEALCPVKTALDDIPVLAVTETQRQNLKQGRAISAPPDLEESANPADGSNDPNAPALYLTEFDGLEIALCEARAGMLYPKRVFNIDAPPID